MNFLVDPGRHGNDQIAEDQMFDDLEDMIGKPNNDPYKAKPKISKYKNGSNSRIVPMNDLDDLEDD